MTTSTTFAESSAAFSGLAEFYDSMHAGRDYGRDARFVASHTGKGQGIAEQYRRIIEWGCGTGAYTLEWQAMGWPVLGVEPSPEMLAVAQSKGVDVICGDIRHSPPLGGRRSIMQACLFGSMSYACLTMDDLLAALSNCRRWAAPRGWLVFDVVNYACAAANLKGLSRRHFIHRGREHKCVQAKRFDLKTGIVSIDLEITAAPDPNVVHSSQHRMRAFSVPEVAYALETCGWQLSSVRDPEAGTSLVTERSYYFQVAAIIE